MKDLTNQQLSKSNTEQPPSSPTSGTSSPSNCPGGENTNSSARHSRITASSATLSKNVRLPPSPSLPHRANPHRPQTGTKTASGATSGVPTPLPPSQRPPSDFYGGVSTSTLIIHFLEVPKREREGEKSISPPLSAQLRCWCFDVTPSSARGIWGVIHDYGARTGRFSAARGWEGWSGVLGGGRGRGRERKWG